MRTGIRRAGLVAVLAAGLLGLASAPAAAAPGESIRGYQAAFQVGSDGLLRATETITYDFGTDSKHGIFRRIPTRFRYDGRHDRVYPLSDIAVQMDGGYVRMAHAPENGDEVLTIGDPDRTITGLHTYTIRYTVRGALNGFADHVELYWNVVGGEWQVPIATATATVSGPAPIGRVRCFAGPPGSQRACAAASVDGASATFRQADIGNGAGMTAVIAFPAGSVSNLGPILVERHDLANAFWATPVTVGGGVAAGLLGVGAVLLVAWLVGRDRRYAGLLPGLTPGYGETGVEERKPLFGKPPVSVEFVPPPLQPATASEHRSEARSGTSAQPAGAFRPDGRTPVKPGQVGALLAERATVRHVTATIIDMAVRRHLHIRELPRAVADRRDWELTKLTGAEDTFAPYERTLFHALFRGRDTVRLSKLKNTFAADLGKVRASLEKELVEQGWYRRSPARTRTRVRAVLILLAAIGVTVMLGLLAHAALIGLGLVVAAAVLLALSGRLAARTGRGSAMLARVQGFRLYVATAEAEQIRFEEREQIFSRYLPYAMVFGLADRWARTFADIGAVGVDGATGLYWYAGPFGFTMEDFDRSLTSFSSTTAGALSSTPPSASGTSGFSGGGFSGGGGGGGGGGSW